MASHLTAPITYGNALSFWVEYPSGLIDLSRSQHPTGEFGEKPPVLASEQVDIPVDGGRTIRIDTKSTAMIVIDMQKCVTVYITIEVDLFDLSKYMQLLSSP